MNVIRLVAVASLLCACSATPPRSVKLNAACSTDNDCVQGLTCVVGRCGYAAAPTITSITGDLPSGAIGNGLVVAGANLTSVSGATLNHATSDAVVSTLTISAQSETSLALQIPAKDEAAVSTGNTVLTLSSAQGAARQAVQILRGETGAAGAAGPAGASAPGPFGNGSAGAKTVSTSTLADLNLQFTDFTVPAGVTLTVASGTIIRCSGTFTNAGTILVEQAASRGGYLGLSTTPLRFTYTSANPGLSRQAPAQPDMLTTTGDLGGGYSGKGVGEDAARRMLKLGFLGGGGGTGVGVVGGEPDHQASGGGTLTVLARSGINNSGVIQADGYLSGASSGGGGGIIVLASSGSITQSGTLFARGSAGAGSSTFQACGGGGGGGIIHLLSPTLSGANNTNVSGGAKGNNTINVNDAMLRVGGGGGGGSGGDGGNGCDVSAGNIPTGGSAGSAGYSFVTTVDPSALF